MSMEKPVAFRPSIVICVGAVGQRIHEHLARLCEGLDEPLRAGVACLYIGERDDVARRLPTLAHAPASAPPPDGGRPNAEQQDAGQPDTNGPFGTAFALALQEVQGAPVNEAIGLNAYAIENPRTQVLIVGHTSAGRGRVDRLAWIAEQVRTRLLAEDFSTEVYYFLSDFREYYESSVLKDARVPDWAMSLRAREAQPRSSDRIDASLGYDLPIVTFGFVYQKKGQAQQTFNSRDVVEYAVAEAVFGMIATMAAAAPGLVEAVQPSPRSIDVTARLGNLGTSLIRFPRAEAHEYCSDMLGVELLEHWIRGMRTGITEAQQAQQRKQAEEFEKLIREWIGGTLWRPPQRAGRDAWPQLAALQPDSRDRLVRYQRSSEQLLAPLSVAEVAKLASSRDDDNAWSEAANINEGKVSEYFPRWEEAARRAWNQIEREIDGRLTSHVDALWLRTNGSWEEAKAYVNALGEQITAMKELLVRWRRDHERRYRQATRRFHALARPIPGADEPTILGGEDVPTDTLARPDAMGTEIGIVGPSGGVPPLPSQTATRGPQPTMPTISRQYTQSVASQSKDPRDEEQRQLRRGIERRIGYLRKRVPAVAALVALVLIAAPPMSLLAFDILPPDWGVTPGLSAIVVSATCALLAATSWAYRRWCLGRLRDCELALVECSRLYYRYRCARHEDNLRAELLMTFHWRVQAMREQLRDWPQHLANLADELRQNATDTEHRLFHGPSGARDVLIGSGERLLDSLRPVATEVRRQRLDAPAESWHSSLERMNEQLRALFRALPHGVIGSEVAVLKEHMRTFTRRVVEPYLAGRLASISAALRGADGAGVTIWHDAQHRATPLYLGYGTDSLTIVCGRREDLRSVAAMPLSRETTLLRTQDSERNREWLLVAQFVQGGLLTNWPLSVVRSRGTSQPTHSHVFSADDADDDVDDVVATFSASDSFDTDAAGTGQFGSDTANGVEPTDDDSAAGDTFDVDTAAPDPGADDHEGSGGNEHDNASAWSDTEGSPPASGSATMRPEERGAPPGAGYPSERSEPLVPSIPYTTTPPGFGSPSSGPAVGRLSAAEDDEYLDDIPLLPLPGAPDLDWSASAESTHEPISADELLAAEQPDLGSDAEGGDAGDESFDFGERDDRHL